MTPPAPELPYVDEHAITIPVPREQVWAGLERYVAGSLRRAERSPLTRILGTEPRAGFEVAEQAPQERLTLVGRHRFARYMLAFELADEPDGTTQLRAQTYAAFPGIHGGIYRGLVIGTRGHTLATRHILRSVRRASVSAGDHTSSVV